MLTQAERIKAYLLKQVNHHAQDLVAVTAAKFKVSRMTVHRHLLQLIASNHIIKTGTTRKVAYFLQNEQNISLSFPIIEQKIEYEVWQKYLAHLFKPLAKTVYDIAEYTFTEVFNNAFDHSRGRQVTVKLQWTNQAVEIQILDDGVGIFDKLASALNYENPMASILQLSKGKLTTDPANHSGEGLFFTSRACSFFSIAANGIAYIRDNREPDWFIQQVATPKRGTEVKLVIDLQSTTQLENVFQQYQSEDSFAFSKTDALVKLSLLGDERFISRSQAKRVLRNLEQFQSVMFDFHGVAAVGQGFVDEVFRVFAQRYPEIKLSYRNANEAVEFMIRRTV